MTVSSLDSVTRRTMASLITFYQTQISPHKGFSCAHRVLYGGASCSQYIKGCIQTQSLTDALPLIQERFEDCKFAHQLLKSRQKRRIDSGKTPAFPALAAPEPPPDEHPASDQPPDQDWDENSGDRDRRLNQVAPTNPNNTCLDSACSSPDCASFGCDGLDCFSDCHVLRWQGCDGSGLHCGLSDCGALDCSGANCSTLDCSALDCSALDCGSCDFASCSS